ncbi:hypothetical protein BaRGS_00024563 [Batillaria attramentaria]|uniref:Uncharacterized protein n=1 Tax=Batillaria attramentaria TaxID=370345 RepID=A0ABD0KAQ9_9CAEN
MDNHLTSNRKARQSGTPGATEISPASVVIIVIVVVIVVAVIVAAFVCWRKGWCRKRSKHRDTDIGDETGIPMMYRT